MTPYEILRQAQCLRVSDGQEVPLWSEGNADLVSADARSEVSVSDLDIAPAAKQLVVVLPHLGDFDSLEYAWWLVRGQEKLRSHQINLRIVAIGDRAAGQRFCQYTGLEPERLWIDPEAKLHQQLKLYAGLGWSLPGLSPAATAWMNLLLMCAGVGSPGTLAEVLRGYRGDRQAPQLIQSDEVVEAKPLPPIQGSTFDRAGGRGFQRPFELATLRLRNMAESLSHWRTYVPDARYLTQRGGTFLFDSSGQLLYEHRDRGILGFSETMARPLTFLDHTLHQA